MRPKIRTLALLVLLLLVAGELRWGWVTVIPAEPYVWHVDAPFETGAYPPADWQQWVTTFWDRGPLPLPVFRSLETYGVLWNWSPPPCANDNPPCGWSAPIDPCAQKAHITFPMTDEATRQRYAACTYTDTEK
jgi:hypothetical protein